MSQRKRNWCFTVHEKDGYDLGQHALEFEGHGVRYAIWQIETCPQSGRRHYQGYIEFDKSVRMGAVKRIIGDHAHLEARRGTRDEARDYCRKEDTRTEGPYEYGTWAVSRGGRPNVFSDIADRAKDGSKLRDIMEEFPEQYIRYRRGIEAMVNMHSRKRACRWRDVEVLVYYGAAGSGKTRKAIDDAGDDFYILDQSERVWFDGYSGEGTLIIDDFYGWIKHGMLLRILDGHPYRAEIKGGFTYGEWRRVVITSNKHPEQWYQHGMTDALQRRINKIDHFE